MAVMEPKFRERTLEECIEDLTDVVSVIRGENGDDLKEIDEKDPWETSIHKLQSRVNKALDKKIGRKFSTISQPDTSQRVMPREMSRLT